MILVSWTPLHHMIPSLLSFMCFFCCISKKMISNLFKSYLMFDNLFRCFSSNSCMTSMMKKADGLSESDGMLTTATFCYWNISELNNMLIYVDSVCFFVFFFFFFNFLIDAILLWLSMSLYCASLAWLRICSLDLLSKLEKPIAWFIQLICHI